MSPKRLRCFVVGCNNEHSICVTASCWSAHDTHQRALLLDHCLFVLNFISHHPLICQSCLIVSSCVLLVLLVPLYIPCSVCPLLPQYCFLPLVLWITFLPLFSACCPVLDLCFWTIKTALGSSMFSLSDSVTEY